MTTRGEGVDTEAIGPGALPRGAGQRIFRRGEIWLANLGDLVPSRHEQRGIGRPVLVVSTDQHNAAMQTTAVVLPITSRLRGWRTHVPLAAGTANLRHDSAAMVEQIRVVDARRLTRRVGTVAADQLSAVTDRIRIMLGT